MSVKKNRHKVKVTSKFHSTCTLLTIDISSFRTLFIHNGRYIACFYCFIHVSHTFAETELVKAVLK